MTLEEELNLYEEYLVTAKRFEQFSEIQRYSKQIEEIKKEIEKQQVKNRKNSSYLLRTDKKKGNRQKGDSNHGKNSGRN